MILIAESGATKTDWRIIDNNDNIRQARTQGYNPYHQDYEDIRDDINAQLPSQVGESEVEKIFFYGAGCATKEGQDVISKALEYSFQKAEIDVNTDLLAAARGLCGHEAGIACILGTGSNSCLYDGKEIVKNIPPLGFIIADEGSGAYLGKRLLADYLRGDMPEELREKFTERYKLDRAMILDNVYNKDKPGRYIASFTKFIFHHVKAPYMHNLVHAGFTEFFIKNVLRYDNYKKQNVNFTGGVAFYFNEILREVARDMGVSVQKIVENPIAGLTLFHKPM